jgi:hypothetical protein
MSQLDENLTENEKQNIPVEETAEVELTHSDKVAGIFTEPSITYEKISKFPIRTIDWLLPIFLMLVVVSISSLAVMSNPTIKEEVKQKRIETAEQRLNDLVKEGKISESQAQEQKDRIEEQFSKMGSPLGIVITSVSILFFGFVIFFIVAGVYFIIAKFILNDDGTYPAALVASGMTSYIAIISIVLSTVLSLFFNRWVQDMSVASLIGMDKKEITGFILSKIDVFTIWIYIVLSIGLAKLFKAKNTAKYFVLVFGLWIAWSVLIFVLVKTIPFMKNFIM